MVSTIWFKIAVFPCCHPSILCYLDFMG